MKQTILASSYSQHSLCSQMLNNQQLLYNYLLSRCSHFSKANKNLFCEALFKLNYDILRQELGYVNPEVDCASACHHCSLWPHKEHGLKSLRWQKKKHPFSVLLFSVHFFFNKYLVQKRKYSATYQWTMSCSHHSADKNRTPHLLWHRCYTWGLRLQ